MDNTWSVERIGNVIYVYESVSGGEALRAESDGKDFLYTDCCNFPIDIMEKFLREVRVLQSVMLLDEIESHAV